MTRLQKYLAACGVASRRNSEKIILDGRVRVNGITVTEMGTQVDEEKDIVEVDGVRVKPEEEKHYLAYYKPVGEVTTVSDPEGRATVKTVCHVTAERFIVDGIIVLIVSIIP